MNISWKFISIATWVMIVIFLFFFFYKRRKWFAFGTNVLLGQQLHGSINQLYYEIAKKNITRDTLADVSKHILWRLTRVGFFAVFVALLPTIFLILQSYLLSNQNNLIENQNLLLYNQNSLLEADRRSSLVFLMSNVLDKVDDEIKHQSEIFIENDITITDSIKFQLSNPLVGRIIALSRAFRPYRILNENGELSNLKSPERGQLFLSLINSNLDEKSLGSIVYDGDFSNAIIGRIKLYSPYLRGINLSNGDIKGSFLMKANIADANLSNINLYRTNLEGADLSLTNLSGANLSGSDLRKTKLTQTNFLNADARGVVFSDSYGNGVNFNNTDLQEAYFARVDFGVTDTNIPFVISNFQGANLRKAIFKNSNLRLVNFNQAKLEKAEFINANLSDATLKAVSLNMVNLSRANLKHADLSYVNFKGVKNLTIDQLLETRTLYKSKNLEKEIEIVLFNKKPCLFIEEGCTDSK